MLSNKYNPPYYAVIFTSIKSDNQEGYPKMADRMIELAAKQDGFLGVETAQEDIGITVSYWRDLESIKNWKENNEHRVAREMGKSNWYSKYITRIAKVEREYSYNKE